MAQITQEEKSKWALPEVDRLIKAVALYKRANGKPNWVKVANYVGTRNRTQCCQRYMSIDSICCARTKRSRQWRREEEHMLVNLFPTIGNDWRKYPKLIPGRTYNDIKSKFTNLCRRHKNGYVCFRDDSALEHKLEKCCKLRERLGRHKSATQCIPDTKLCDDEQSDQDDIQPGSSRDRSTAQEESSPEIVTGMESTENPSVWNLAYEQSSTILSETPSNALGCAPMTSSEDHSVPPTCSGLSVLNEQTSAQPQEYEDPVNAGAAEGRYLTAEDIERMISLRLNTIIEQAQMVDSIRGAATQEIIVGYPRQHACKPARVGDMDGSDAATEKAQSILTNIKEWQQYEEPKVQPSRDSYMGSSIQTYGTPRDNESRRSAEIWQSDCAMTYQNYLIPAMACQQDMQLGENNKDWRYLDSFSDPQKLLSCSRLGSFSSDCFHVNSDTECQGNSTHNEYFH